MKNLYPHLEKINPNQHIYHRDIFIVVKKKSNKSTMTNWIISRFIQKKWFVIFKNTLGKFEVERVKDCDVCILPQKNVFVPDKPEDIPYQYF